MNKKILIVEEDISVSEEVLCRLIETGHEVAQTAFSTEQALEALAQKPLGLVLIDTALVGEMDGFELAETIRNDHQVPFMFLDTTGEQYMIDRAKRTMPCDVLTQPIDYGKLQVSIEKGLNATKKPPGKSSRDKDSAKRAAMASLVHN